MDYQSVVGQRGSPAKRLGKNGLTPHPEKTRLIELDVEINNWVDPFISKYLAEKNGRDSAGR